MSSAESGILHSRPSADLAAGLGPGLHWLDVSAVRRPALYVPSRPLDGEVPLVVLLHGAGGDAQGTLPLLEALADQRGFLLLVPQSAGRTWDVILGAYGPDIDTLDRALSVVFQNFKVDPKRIAVSGFSDGASYALSIGVSNGKLFSDVLAFSPGFLAPARISGQPRIFVSHGTRDEVLPIDRCSRRLVPQLSRAGYDVDYREFDGPHVVPPDLASLAVDRFLDPPGEQVVH